MPWRDLEIPSDDEMRELRQEFRGRARFLVDENAGNEVAELLKGQGYNTRTAAELGLHGRGDEEIFAAAWKEERVIITHDDDFLDNREFPQSRNPGVVVIRPGADGRDDDGLVRCLLLTLMIVGSTAAWFKGKKMEFTSSEAVAITSAEGRRRFLWKRKGNPQVWEDEEER